MTATEEETRLWKMLESRADRDLDDWERALENAEKKELYRSMWMNREFTKLNDKLQEYETEFDGKVPVKLETGTISALRKYQKIMYPELDISEVIQKIVLQHLRCVENFTPGFVYSDGAN